MKKKFKYLQYALHVAVLAGLVYAGLKYVEGDAFARAMARFQWGYAPLICALSLGYVLIKGWRFTKMMREITDAPRTTIMKAYVAGQAVTLLPGGMAGRAAILEQIGIPAAETAAPIAVSSMTDQAMFLLCSLIAALWFEDARKPVLILLTGLAVVSVLLGVEATRTWFLGLIERLMGRLKMRDHWQEFVGSFKQVTTLPLLLGGLANTALAFVCLVLALHLAMRGVGAAVPPMTLLLAFTLPTMLGRISALPGGVGVTEAGMVGILDHAPGVTLDQAAAAVLVFRLGTVVFAAFAGGLVYFLGWRGRKEKVAVDAKADAANKAASRDSETDAGASADITAVVPATTAAAASGRTAAAK